MTLIVSAHKLDREPHLMRSIDVPFSQVYGNTLWDHLDPSRLSVPRSVSPESEYEL
jgi:hypothetical protein